MEYKNYIIKELNNRIIQISIKHKLSHLGSCLTSLPIIYDIYQEMKNDDVFVLSSGHAGLALYVVIEHLYSINAEELLKYGIHPEKSKHIYVSTGSLGIGLSISAGIALASPEKNVYCLISDGECYEGIIWETLSFIKTNNINNINVYCNMNGWSAYSKIDIDYLTKKLHTFLPSINIINTDVDNIIKFEHPLSAHYKIAENWMIQKI